MPPFRGCGSPRCSRIVICRNWESLGASPKLCCYRRLGVSNLFGVFPPRRQFTDEKAPNKLRSPPEMCFALESSKRTVVGKERGMSDSEQVMVFITVGSLEEADKIAHALVERMLAACVNIVPSVTSVYRWQDEVQRDSEVLLIVKSRRNVFEHLARCVKELHGYETPEIIALPIVAGDVDYLRWLDASVPGGWHAVD